jgi:hypothetical protein
MSGVITIAIPTAPTQPVSFYAVRRFYSSVTEIALLYAEQGASESTLVSQTALLENGQTFGSIISGLIPALPSSVYWSEAFARDELPVLLLTAQNASATQGIVADTSNYTVSTLNLTRISDSSFGDVKAALTNYGLVRVMSLAPPLLRLTVGYASNTSDFNQQPPLLVAAGNWQTSNPCDIPLFDNTGPFANTNYSENNDFIGLGWSAPSTDCFNIAYNGSVTMYIEYLPNVSGYNHYAYRFTPPAPTSSSTAELSWTVSNLIVTAATGTNHPYAVFRCNSGTTVMVTQDTGVLSLKSVNAAFNAVSVDFAGGTILESQFGTGIVFAYGDDQLLWFCNAYDGASKNSHYRYINASTQSFTLSNPTGFIGDLLTADLLVYAGTNGANLYVATSDGTNVYLHYFNGTNWSNAGQIITTSGGIVDLLADIIVGDSALIVAVLSSSVVCYTHSLV